MTDKTFAAIRNLLLVAKSHKLAGADIQAQLDKIIALAQSIKDEQC